MSDMDYEVAHGIAQIENAKLRAENERLRAALQAIDGINDNPSCFRIEIDQIIRRALGERK